MKHRKKKQNKNYTLYFLIFAILLFGVFMIGKSSNNEIKLEIIDENKNIDETIKGDDSMTIVKFETTLGEFEVELFDDKAPISTKNFLEYVNEGYYDGLIFHRVISNFMVQGGGFDSDMNEKETKPAIKNEADNGLKNVKYTLAMARTNEVDSATSQFFINVADNVFLDNGARDFGYAVFAKVISGEDTVEKIRVVKTTTKGHYTDVPETPVIINKAYVK
jgi:peptidyl-prolyl cis-trans isomerase A (cyclophilin A)